MRYQVVQSKVNPDSWYVDDTHPQQNKTIAMFLKPYGKLFAEEYAEILNERESEREAK